VKYKGIVFDLDSTLIHSKVDFPKMKTNMIRVLEENGVPRGILSPTEQTTVVILEKSEEIWERQGKPEEERVKLRAVMEEFMNRGELEAVDKLSEVHGAAETIHKLKERGYKLAILTRGHHEYATGALRKTGMLDAFDLILGRGETPKPKPYKEALQHTVEQMRLSLRDILFVGDHQIDADSAKNTGCSFVGVATGRRGLDSWAGKIPEVLLDSVADLPDYLADCDS